MIKSYRKFFKILINFSKKKSVKDQLIRTDSNINSKTIKSTLMKIKISFKTSILKHNLNQISEKLCKANSKLVKMKNQMKFKFKNV
jgi:hypothetical protein